MSKLTAPKPNSTFNVQISVTKTTHHDNGKIESVSDPAIGGYSITDVLLDSVKNIDEFYATKAGYIVKNLIAELRKTQEESTVTE